jgi:hypothetical protein
MKKLVTSLVCIFLVVFSIAQNPKEETPSAVKTSFAAKYPKAQKVKWSVEKPGEFEVEFTLNNVAKSTFFDAKGKLLETEGEMK